MNQETPNIKTGLVRFSEALLPGINTARRIHLEASPFEVGAGTVIDTFQAILYFGAIANGSPAMLFAGIFMGGINMVWTEGIVSKHSQQVTS